MQNLHFPFVLLWKFYFKKMQDKKEMYSMYAMHNNIVRQSKFSFSNQILKHITACQLYMYFIFVYQFVAMLV